MADVPAPLVLPFFRASVILRASDQRLWDPDLSAADFLTALRESPVVFRHNVRRVLAAAERAHSEPGEIVLAEGWKSNVLAPGDDPLCGAEVAERLLRLLQARGLTAFDGAVHRLDTSCCTWQEILCVQAAFPQRSVIGVTSSPCPSAARARRTFRLIYGAPIEVISDGVLSPEPQAVMDACATPSGWLAETINWGVHALSELARRVFRSQIPLEMRWAIRMRK